MSSPQREIAPDQDDVCAAREVARRVVADRWPELAATEPSVTLHRRVHPSSEILQRAGMQPSDIVFTPDGADSEYTFTFTKDTCTPEGHALPRIARVTVDSQRHVVKATVSK